MSLSTGPISASVVVMPVPLHSARSAAVKWLRPAFDVEYGASPGSAFVPASDDTFMM